jgi:hypothetical protein
MHSCRDLLKFCVTHQRLQTVQIQERSSHVLWPLSQLTKVNKVQLFQACQGGYALEEEGGVIRCRAWVCLRPEMEGFEPVQGIKGLAFLTAADSDFIVVHAGKLLPRYVQRLPGRHRLQAPIMDRQLHMLDTDQACKVSLYSWCCSFHIVIVVWEVSLTTALSHPQLLETARQCIVCNVQVADVWVSEHQIR